MQNLPSQPQNIATAPGNGQITLSWNSVADATGYSICYASAPITAYSSGCGSALGSIQVLSNQTSPTTITGLTNGTLHYFSVLPVNTTGTGTPSTIVANTPTAVATVMGTHPLNDTGMVLCGDYPYATGGSTSPSNSENCSHTSDSAGDPIPRTQDGHIGRDVTHNNSSNGHAGFHFTKLDTNGAALAFQPGIYSASPWRCVKDEVTNLTWEVKDTSSTLTGKYETFTWFSPNVLSVGTVVINGNEGSNHHSCSGYIFGTSSTYCNTDNYVSKMNTANLCGHNDWRIPTREELRSIMDMSRTYSSSPMLDPYYFPNTSNMANGRYWSSTTMSSDIRKAWAMSFKYGTDVIELKETPYHVRLVR